MSADRNSQPKQQKGVKLNNKDNDARALYIQLIYLGKNLDSFSFSITAGETPTATKHVSRQVVIEGQNYPRSRLGGFGAYG